MPWSPDAIVPHLVLLLVALGLDAVFGGRAGLFATVPHPVRLIGWLIGRLDAALNLERDADPRRRALGVLTVALVCGLCGGIGWTVAALAHRFWPLLAVELALMVSLLAQRSLFIHVRAVADALGTGGLAAGRIAVAHIVGRDVERLDEAGVARAAIESAAENFSDGVVAPVFWAVLFGLPGLLVYKAANTLDSMIGHHNTRYRAFGWAAARLDDAFNFVPARLSGLFFVAAAAVLSAGSSTPASSFRGGVEPPRGNPDSETMGRAALDRHAACGARDDELWYPRRAWVTMLRDAHRHRSPNAGWSEAAAAGALALRLGGPRRYGGRYGEATLVEPWLGDGRAEATAADIDRMLRLYVAACAVNAALVAVVAVLDLAT